MISLQLLGSVELRAGDLVAELGPPQQRLVLAALAVAPRRLVTVETLIDRVWDEAPAGARRTLHVYITRLRRAIEKLGDAAQAVRLVRRSGGYVLDIDAGLIDVHRFRDLVERTRDPNRPEAERLAQQREAVRLWQGEPLAGLSGHWAARMRDAWVEDYLQLAVSWGQAEVRAGNHGAVLSRLAELAGERPLVESVAAVLMQALAAAGRPADALAHYARIRRQLAEELGTDPGTQLQAVHEAILRDDTHPAAYQPAAHRGIPAQLPADVPVFTGRVQELDRLTAVLVGRPGGTVVISAVGGAGKTSLALRWAHQHRDRFPDGQLFANLRGFDPSGEPMPAATAVRGLLDALGVAHDALPPGTDAQAALYRSLVSGRRMLIVLDNARDSDQVAPLLPGSATCAVMVTSRDQLIGLISGYGAEPVQLGMLTDVEAHDLMARRLGRQRLASESDAAAALVAACGGLPLALGIAAARAALQPHLRLRVLATELEDAATRMAALDEGDQQASLREVMTWSYRALTPQQARVFGLLGLAPGPDIGEPAVAALVDLPADEVRRLLRTLERQSLVMQPVAGRWRLHDLVRLYAAERAHDQIAEANGEQALRRLVDFLVRTTLAADGMIGSRRKPLPIGEPACVVVSHPLPDRAAAMSWLETEHESLLAAGRFAAGRGWDDVVWQLAYALNTYHWRRGQLQALVATCRDGLAAARRMGDLTALSVAHRLLGDAYSLAGDPAEAIEHLDEALVLAERAGDLADQLYAHAALAPAWAERGDDERALHHAVRGVDLLRRMDRPEELSQLLNMVGWYSAQLGRYEQARVHLDEALIGARHYQDRFAEANTLDSLGFVAHATERYAEAIGYYEEALAAFRGIGSVSMEAEVLERLGDTFAAAADRDGARRAFEQASDLYRTQHRQADADRVDEQVARL